MLHLQKKNEHHSESLLSCLALVIDAVSSVDGGNDEG